MRLCAMVTVALRCKAAIGRPTMFERPIKAFLPCTSIMVEQVDHAEGVHGDLAALLPERRWRVKPSTSSSAAAMARRTVTVTLEG